MSTASIPLGLEHVQNRQFGLLIRRTSRLRLIVGPLMLFPLAASLFGDASLWRKVVLAVGLVANVAIVVLDQKHLRGGAEVQPLRTERLVLSLPLFVAFLLVTGGYESPLLPVLVLLDLVVGLLMGMRTTVIVTAVTMVGVWAFAGVTVRSLIPDLVPAIFGGGPRAGLSDALLYASALSMSLLLPTAAWIGRMMRTTFDGMVKSALDAHNEALANHAEHTRALTALSGELAHELKNPLASVKGLAALVAKDVDGKAAERMAVLRREVDRMQDILDGFLNFSRPLVPLSGGRVALRALCEQVAALHEGLALERGLSVVATGDARLTAWCDPRKVKQVLINLVQNALEASPRSGSVELEVRADGANARLEVRDRGPGLAPGVRDRAFEPGVTTKAGGSGLGLAIARGLARQHGGELALRSREGGGCVAELTLPLDGPPPAASGAA